MSAVLLVTKGNKQVVKVDVTGDVFVIGRAKDCSLPLDESLASRQHSEILREGGAYFVRDRGSRNGTLVNGEKISGKRELKDGDEIEIGETKLKFVWDKSQQEQEDDDDRTRVASPGDLEKKMPGQQVVEKKNKGDFEVKLRVTDGPLQGGVFRNWEGPLTIGRGLNNHVVLIDDAVSTAQAQIIQEGDSYFIEDLKSSNGTFLDGVKIQKTKLSNGQKIRIGVSTLVFDIVDLRKKKRNLKIILITVGSILVLAALAKILQPKDVAGEHIAAAKKYEQVGNLTNALNEFQLALKVDPNRVEAKRGLTQVKAAIEAHDVLRLAEQAAEAENYDKAKDLCYRVLRDFPNNSQALELQAVIKYIENAKIAFASKNWIDAKRLLEKAQDKYPHSKLIQSRLNQAQMEMTAQQNLAKAKDDLAHQQLDLAEPLLKSIPSSSVYYTAAKQALGQIAQTRAIAAYLAKAKDAYRDGHLSGALKELAAGLQQVPDSSSLLKFQTRVRQMEALVKPLEAAEAANQPDDVNALLQNQQACQDVIKLEPDPLNAFRKRAQAAETQVQQKLVQVAQADAAKAAETLQSGDQTGALKLYDLAVKADPSNQDYVEKRDAIRKKIVAACHQLYDQGIVHADLGQTDMARQAFQKILKIGIPGENYYQRASQKLKDMSP